MHSEPQSWKCNIPLIRRYPMPIWSVSCNYYASYAVISITIKIHFLFHVICTVFFHLLNRNSSPDNSSARWGLIKDTDGWLLVAWSSTTATAKPNNKTSKYKNRTQIQRKSIFIFLLKRRHAFVRYVFRKLLCLTLVLRSDDEDE